MMHSSSPWIQSARFDGCFILAPAILTSVLVVVFSDSLQNLPDMPTWLWLLLVVGIDAGHVYASLFRTYFDRQMLAHQPALLTLTPLLVWLAGCLLYNINDLWFWRVLAYLALFHFIRQQYGFMMIYSRHERNLSQAFRQLDKFVLYASTLVPLIIWHTVGRGFHWFVPDDFMLINNPLIGIISQWMYVALLMVYAIKELWLKIYFKQFNWPRNLLIIGTALSWHIGIVSFDNDLIFTATNVIAHGIPYYALIWVYGLKSNQLNRNNYTITWLGKLFHWQTIPLYVGLLMALAYLEEGLWDSLIWREHAHIFGAFNLLPDLSSTPAATWIVPLLTIPQATHYVLDAFIWRLHTKNTDWKKIIFHR